ncbi:hypothetical protein PRUB_a3315 [Pseudoalteromonas rubra]|uniref:Uncharacterized protein n=1 Tax=Pseudoalteromonas rubra TaxID=43658 RepID=A0A8T0C2S3_9GAMM|nr:hypothetical protein [Pseudoalteromonas rubra]KAF7783525.1 hypothetical protein PRUB_a3315 [Pseudoalteromonas rubra]
MEYLNNAYVWGLLFSIASFVATEFFFPVSDDSAIAKKQKHFWAIAIFMIMLLQSLVVSHLFELSKTVEANQNKINSLVNEKSTTASTALNSHKDIIVGSVSEVSKQAKSQYETLGKRIKELEAKIGSVTGFEDVSGTTQVRLLINPNLRDSVVVYDSSSGKFPILEGDGEFWVRLTNRDLLEEPVVEIRIHPKHSVGPEQGTEFVFGVSESTLKILSGGEAKESLRVQAKIVKQST